jgi:ParB family chromosome partitioning protein
LSTGASPQNSATQNSATQNSATQNSATQRRGLGRGFEVLIGGNAGQELAHVPLEQIHANPKQPRRRFDHEATAGLADSIRTQGLIQPVLLRPRAAGGYELIAGERRWRAAKESGLTSVPAVIREADDRDTLLLGLVENVARENLSPIEEARAYAVLTDEFQLSLGEIAERVGRSKPSVSNRMRLLELPDDVLAMVERGELSEGHARAVLAVPDHGDRRQLARKIVRQGLSVRAAERAARWAGARTKPRRATGTAGRVDPQLAARVRAALAQLTGIEPKVTGNRVELPFENETQLAELAEALERVLP